MNHYHLRKIVSSYLFAALILLMLACQQPDLVVDDPATVKDPSMTVLNQ